MCFFWYTRDRQPHQQGPGGPSRAGWPFGRGHETVMKLLQKVQAQNQEEGPLLLDVVVGERAAVLTFGILLVAHPGPLTFFLWRTPGL